MMENFSVTNEWLTFMDAVPEKDEFLALKKELTKLGVPPMAPMQNVHAMSKTGLLT